MLKVQGEISYSNFHLPIDVSIDKKGIYQIIAPSGSGKTSFFFVLLGYNDGFKGQVNVDGDLSISFQNNHLLSHLTVKEQLKYVSDDSDRIEEVLQSLGIDDIFSKRISTLSGGQQRLVNIARALCKEHDLLLLDEPFAFLDEEKIKIVENAVKQFQAKWNTLVLLVSHQSTEMPILKSSTIQDKLEL